MPQLLETFQLNQLQPMQNPEDARSDAIKVKPSITLKRGQALGILTTTGVAEALVPGASNGTQNFVGVSMYDAITDAAGKVFFKDAATNDWRLTGVSTLPFWTCGTFDPADLTTKVTPVAEVDTFTPGTPTAADVSTLTYTAPDGTVTAVSFTTVTTTAAAISAGLIAAWNANATLAAVATATGTTTVVLTALVAGTPFTVASSVVGTGTLTRAATTAASGRSLADILVGAPGSRLLHNGFWKIV